MIIYGWREKEIAYLPIKNHTCSYCNSKNSLNVQVNRSYIHIFWIPFIPLGKKVYTECSHYKQSLRKNEMQPDIQRKALELKSQAKTPFWYYTGLTLIAFVIISFSILIR